MTFTMERFPVQVRAGFDCRNDNPSCPACSAGRPGDHGISGGTAYFAVGAELDGKLYAVALEVLTKKFPPTVPPSPMPDGTDYRDSPPHGGALSFHEESTHGETPSCDWLHGKRCAGEVIGYLVGDKLYRNFGNPDPKADPTDQSEMFWIALEGCLVARLESVARSVKEGQ